MIEVVQAFDRTPIARLDSDDRAALDRKVEAARRLFADRRAWLKTHQRMAFVNDRLDAPVLAQLAKGGAKFVALRCAGYNNVDLGAAEAHGVTVVRVPAYSPYAVAEFTVGVSLALDRQICRGWLRVREDNFSLEGLVGRDLHGKTVGVIGTGRIGALVAKAFKLGFGCEVLAHDVHRHPELEKIGVH